MAQNHLEIEIMKDESEGISQSLLTNNTADSHT